MKDILESSRLPLHITWIDESTPKETNFSFNLLGFSFISGVWVLITTSKWISQVYYAH